MRNLFYYYKNDGTLVLLYSDGQNKKTMRYVFYTLKEAIKKFRKDNNLRYKHIKVLPIY